VIAAPVRPVWTVFGSIYFFSSAAPRILFIEPLVFSPTLFQLLEVPSAASLHGGTRYPLFPFDLLSNYCLFFAFPPGGFFFRVYGVFPPLLGFFLSLCLSSMPPTASCFAENSRPPRLSDRPSFFSFARIGLIFFSGHAGECSQYFPGPQTSEKSPFSRGGFSCPLVRFHPPSFSFFSALVDVRSRGRANVSRYPRSLLKSTEEPRRQRPPHLTAALIFEPRLAGFSVTQYPRTTPGVPPLQIARLFFSPDTPLCFPPPPLLFVPEAPYE